MLGRQQPLLRRFLAGLDHIQASVHPAMNAFLQQQLREATPDPIQPDGGLGAMSEELRALGKPAWTGRLADTLNCLGSATELWLADGAELEQLPKRETAQARLDIWSLRAHVPQVAAHWAADAAACAAELSGHAATEQRSDYVLLMPRAQAVAEPMPLVVALHGGCSRYTRAAFGDLLLCDTWTPALCCSSMMLFVWRPGAAAAPRRWRAAGCARLPRALPLPCWRRRCEA